MRNVLQRADPLEGARNKVNSMAEFEAHNLATPGDVLVIDGVSGMSNMGGISAQTGKRQGEVGAIVCGGVRDVGHSRSVGYPIWSTEISAVTGKWRLQTIEINGPVQIGGVRVEPGDLVMADETSVCFVPRDRMTDVLALAQEKAEAEELALQGDRRGHPGAGYFPRDLWREGVSRLPLQDRACSRARAGVISSTTIRNVARSAIMTPRLTPPLSPSSAAFPIAPR